MTGGPSQSSLTRWATPTRGYRAGGAEDSASTARRAAWWTPLAFVAIVLAVLTATPVLVNYRVRRLRDQLTDGSGAGRVIVNDLEVAFATQLLIHEGENAAGTPAARASGDSLSRLRERIDEVALDSVARRVGPDAVERFVELRTLAESWHDRMNSRVATSGVATARLTRGLSATAQQVLNSAESLDTYFERLALQQRARIRRLERVNMISAVILAPLALAAALALFWTGRRTLFFAHAAERDRAALARAMLSKATLVRGLTHDLKNPLGAAYGYAELLEDNMVGPVSSEQREMLGRIKGLVTLSVTTVNDLLELYRDGSEGLQLQRVPTDVHGLTRTVVADFMAEAQHAKLDIAFDGDTRSESDEPRAATDASTLASTDPARVRQILGNLVTNAIKYTPAGGRVRLSIRGPSKSDPRIAIDVRDTGPGIPAPFQERIFEEFFRLPENEGIAGSGVGLAISRRFARLLGGDITVTDWFEGGSVFTLWLPANRTGKHNAPVRVA
jgi:signal transduction histidine kinase